MAKKEYQGIQRYVRLQLPGPWVYPDSNHPEMIAMDVPDVAPQWGEVELVFQAEAEVENPYLEVDMWIDFRHEEGEALRRPAFWDGSSRWCVRFASTLPEGTWEWESVHRWQLLAHADDLAKSGFQVRGEVLVGDIRRGQP